MSKIIVVLNGGIVTDTYLEGTGKPTETIIIDDQTDGMDEALLTMDDWVYTIPLTPTVGSISKILEAYKAKEE